MTNYKSKTICVFDHGLFVELAITLSKSFGRTIYYAPWESGYPKSNTLRIGQGVAGIERVSSPWSYVDDIDLWIFPDVYEGDLQQYLVDQGKRVWGCRTGEELELDRVASKERSGKLGIDIGPYKVITGLDALREHLKKHDNQWVKLSATRGDGETFGAKNYAHVEQRLDEWEHRLGAKKKIMEFIVEDAIDPAIEVGYDGYTIDGKFPTNGIIGVEVKDQAYVGRAIRYDELPKQVRSVNDKLAPALKDYGYRGFLSTEIRCSEDGGAYLIDPCARCGSPPSELYQVMYSNLAEIIWEGAGGAVVEPKFKKRWGAEVMLTSSWADENWQQVKFPASIRENVKLRNMTVIDGEYYVIPQWTGCPDIGAVVAMGDTAEEAIKECKRLAEKVEGFQMDKPIKAIDEAHENLTDLIGEDKPKSKAEQRADKLLKRGTISEKQHQKLIGA